MTRPGPLIAVDDPSEGVTVTAAGQLRHLCPHKNEYDEGAVEVSWVITRRKTIELHSLAAFLAAFADRSISHEDVTNQIALALRGLVSEVRVTTTWRTAGLNVSVSA